MAWVMAVVAVGGMAAAAFEIWLARRQHPRRFQYAWAAWTPVAFSFLFAGAAESGGDVIGQVVLAFVIAPIVYPVVRAFIWMRFASPTWGSTWQQEEAALDAERMKYRATDFGGVRTAPNPPSPPARTPPPRPVDSPIALPAATSRLDLATRDRRPAWVRGAEMTLAVGLGAVAFSLYLALMIANRRGGDEPGHEEMIAATLEFNGYGGPRVESAGDVCADGRSLAYGWSAMGAAGRACVDPDDGRVSLWVNRRWPAVR